jgi:TPR repeat protein
MERMGFVSEIKERSMKRYWAAFIILAGMVILSAGCVSDPYQDGFKAYRGGDYAAAKQELTALAEAGDSEAQLYLGMMYRDGLGVLPDHHKAEKWLKRSAEQENVSGRIALASLYADRQGFVNDDIKALMWFNFAVAQGSKEAERLRDNLTVRMTPVQVAKAQRISREYKSDKEYEGMVRSLTPQAESGDAAAQMKLGTLYYNGQGVNQDYAEAARLFRLAAEKGDPYAQSNLAYMCEVGEGVPQDYQEAAKWYLKAAEQGNVQAQFYAGRLYEKGQGIEQNDVIALSYYILASAGGEARATVERDRLTAWMAPDQVAEAQTRAREFKVAGKK